MCCHQAHWLLLQGTCPWLLATPRYKNPKDPTIAPAFPAAAEIPWQVDRSLAGKISAGMTNVVALGPKLAKKKVREYMTMNPILCSFCCQWWYGIPRASINTVMKKKPIN